MPFRQGRYAEIVVSGVALTTFTDSVDMSRDVDLLETTTFTATSKTFLAGLQDGKIDIKGKYDPTAVSGPAFVLASLVGANNSVPIVYYPGGNTAGQRKVYFNGYLASYKESSAIGDVVGFDATIQADGPILASGI